MSELRQKPVQTDELQLIVDEPLELESRDDAAELVPRLAPQSFLRVARQLRDEGRVGLLIAHATPEQLTSLFDLDVWDLDRVNVPRARHWLTAIAECYFAAGKPRGALARLIYAMDPEMWTFALAVGAVVIEVDPEQDDSRDQALAELAGLDVFETPDGVFVVGATDDELGRMALHVIRRVYDDGLDVGRNLVMSIMGVLVSQIEEELYRWRSGRLADLGFVDWEEAMRVFRPLDRDAAANRAATEAASLAGDGPPIEPLVEWNRTDLLRRVLDRLEPGEHGVRARQFMLLVNEVMAAQRFAPGDESRQERAILQAQATITLGLEMLATTRPGEPDAIGFLADRVEVLGLRDVFRVGYGALDQLRAATLALHREGRVSMARVGSLLDRPWGPALAALSGWYPELPIESTGAQTRPLRSLSDVARATELIAEAGALAVLTFDPRGYGIDPIWITRVDDPQRITLGDLVRTASIHAQLPHSTTTLAPVSPEDLEWARSHLLVDGKLVPAVRQDLEARGHELEIEKVLGTLASNLLTRLEVELAALEPGDDGLPDLTKTRGFVTIQDVGLWLTSRTAAH